MNLFKTIVILAIFMSSGCGRSITTSANQPSDAGNGITKAERFRLVRKNGYTLLTILNPWQGAENITQIYYLVNRGLPIPVGIDSSMVIFVPLQKIICMSTTHTAMISVLHEEKSIAGVSGKNYIFSSSLNDRIRKGLIEDVGYETNLNKELILRISPDLIMMYAIGSESNSYIGKVKELGIKSLFNADYLETDPLGKSEWIKMFGALYCKENVADSIFKSVSQSYNTLKSFISENISGKPKIMLGLPFKETWYVSPGNSFISKLIDDAGGEYLWRNTESSVSMPFGIENVYMRALSADYWLNIGSIKTRDEISFVDQRLKDLPCFKRGNLFNNNNRVTDNGGNDYWESGTIYPQIILKDIASILHPGLFPDYKLVYFRRVD
jgi:iron complex transport system substrate-binding protein